MATIATTLREFAQRHVNLTVRALTLACLVAIGQPASGDLAISASAIGIAHDNIALAPSGEEEREYVRSFSPAIRYRSRELATSTVDVMYRYESLHYAGNSERDTAFHQLNAAAALELAEDRFFLDALAFYDQTTVTPEETFAFSNLNLTGNRANLALIGVEPWMHFEPGERVSGTLRFAHQSVRYDDDALADGDLQALMFRVGKTADDIGSTWALRYAVRHIDIGELANYEYQQLALEVGRWITGGLRIFATLGRESDFFLEDAPVLDQTYWEAGLELRTGERSSLMASVGERFFSQRSYRFSVDRQLRAGALYMRYFEEPSTYSQRYFNNIQSLGQIISVDDALSIAGADIAFIQKRFESGINIESDRGTLVFAAIVERQLERRSPTDDVIQGNLELRAVNLGWRYRLGSRLSFLAGLELGERQIESASGGDRLGRFTLGLDRELGRRSHFSALLLRERAEPIDGVSRRYSANLFVLRVGSTFGRGTPVPFSQSWL